jgi:hypothetical protein
LVGAVLSAAAEAGIVRLTGGQVRLVHPLLGSVAYYQSTAAERRACTARSYAVGQVMKMPPWVKVMGAELGSPGAV